MRVRAGCDEPASDHDAQHRGRRHRPRHERHPALPALQQPLRQSQGAATSTDHRMFRLMVAICDSTDTLSDCPRLL